MGIFPTPNSSQTVAVPAATDWVAVSKTIVIEVGFIGSLISVLLGNHDPNVINIVWATGGVLGLLRMSDIAANVMNVKSFLAKPGSGVVPQAVGTPLITTPTIVAATPNGGPNGSPSAT